MRRMFRLASIIAGLAAPAAALGQMPTAGPLTVHPVASKVYWAEGAGGNVGIIVGDKGVILVDATVSPEGGKRLLAEVAKLTPRPVTTVILTHGDMDHVGGLAAFPPGTDIIAQENTRKRLADNAAAGRGAVPVDRLPGHRVAAREAVTIDGVKLELLHWSPAHTDGDLVVYLPTQKVAFTGDIFAIDQPRALIHLEQRGTSQGWIQSAKAIAALDADRFVVGHGDVQTKAALRKRIDQSAAERAEIVKLVAKGDSLAEIQAKVGDPPPGPARTGGGPVFPPFSAVVYQELTGKK